MGTAAAVVTGKGKYGGEVVKTFKIVLGKPEITSLTETNDKNVLIKWSEVSGADGYYAFCADHAAAKRADGYPVGRYSFRFLLRDGDLAF